MDVRPLVIHVLDPVFGLIVLHPGPRHFTAHPSRLTTGEGLARRLFAEYPAVVFRADAIVVEAGYPANRPFSDGEAVRLQLAQTWPKAWIDITLQDLCGRVDMGVGVVHAEAVFHAASPFSALTFTAS